jgi:Tfp pilus assembly protein PilV
MSRLFKNKIGLTLTEMLVAVLLLSLVFMAVSSLCVASQRFYITSSDSAMIGYELQYAMDHIQKNAMQAIGDKRNDDNAPIKISSDGLVLTIRHIDKADPNDSPAPTYSDYTDDKEITYTISNGILAYKKALNSGIIEQDDNMIPKVKILTEADSADGRKLSEFYIEGNVLKIKLTAEFIISRQGNMKKSFTLYSAGYPRMASFH